MNDREAFEKWACTVNKVPTAWEGWQASSNKAIETLAAWMLSRGFSTGHGDTIDDLLTELGGQITQPALPDGWIKVMRGMAEYAECNDPRNPYLQQAQALLSAGKETDK